MRGTAVMPSHVTMTRIDEMNPARESSLSKIAKDRSPNRRDARAGPHNRNGMGGEELIEAILAHQEIFAD